MSVITSAEAHSEDLNRPEVSVLDWGEQGIVFCEYGNTAGWIKAPESDLVRVER